MRMCIGSWNARGQSEDDVIDIMKMLLQFGSDIREVDCDGRTLLHEIVVSDTMHNTRIIAFLVEMGVVNSCDVQGMSAGELARADTWDDNLIGVAFSDFVDTLFYTPSKRRKSCQVNDGASRVDKEL